MRKFLRVVIAAALGLQVGVGVARVDAAPLAAVSCATWSYSETFSPPFPAPGDPNKVVLTIAGSGTFSGCVGFGITSGTLMFTGGTLTPVNCTTGEVEVGTSTMKWSTGQTSTFVDLPLPFLSFSQKVTSGLFSDALTEGTPQGGSDSCVSGPTSTQTYFGTDFNVFLSHAPSSCGGTRSCDTSQVASATASAPGLGVTVAGKPAVGTGTLDLKIATGRLSCPRVPGTDQPVATVTKTGFAPTDRLNIAATLPLTSATSAEEVCFQSKVPFKGQGHPTIATAGTDFLLACATAANVPPCVTSTKQIGSNVVVKFVVPGNDPNFTIVTPNGREAWASRFGTGTVGKPFSARVNTRGGIAPVRWNILSGALPKGCALNPTSGVITGTPKTKGHFPVVVQATDSEKPAKTATLPLRITIT